MTDRHNSWMTSILLPLGIVLFFLWCAKKFSGTTLFIGLALGYLVCQIWKRWMEAAAMGLIIATANARTAVLNERTSQNMLACATEATRQARWKAAGAVIGLLALVVQVIRVWFGF